MLCIRRLLRCVTTAMALIAGPAYAQSGLGAVDRAALEALYRASGGDDWVDRRGWLTQAPLRDWYGVAVDDDGRVAELHLRANGLVGRVPGALDALDALENLWFADFSHNWGLQGTFSTTTTALRALILAATRVCLQAPLRAAADARFCNEPVPATIDVIVLYTESARRHVGSRSEIEVEIKGFFKDVSSIFTENGFRHTLRVVATDEVGDTYGTQDTKADLRRLADSPEIEALRDAAGADLVHLLVAVDGAEALGVAQLLGPHGLTNIFDRQEDYGDPARIIAHELAHNMGVRHDRYAMRADPRPAVRREAESPDPAFGYVSLDGEWHTLTAYGTECEDIGTMCTWLSEVSNPSRLGPGGWPLGVAFGSPEAADAAAILDATAPIVARWK